MKFTFLAATASGLLLAAAAPIAAHAQSKAEKLVTRDELHACMNSESDLAARRQAVEARHRSNGEEFAAIRAEGQELAEEQKRAEQDASRIDRFQRRVRAHNVKVEAAKAKDAAFRSDLEALNAAVASHNERCGGIAFRPEDKEAILKERDAAGK